MNPAIVLLMIGLVAGAGGGILAYHYVTGTPPNWQTVILSHFSLTSSDSSAFVNNISFLYEGNYVWNNTTPTSSIVSTVGIWSMFIDLQSSELTITNLRLLSLDVYNVANGSPDYLVMIYFLFAPTGLTLKYDGTIVNSPTAFNVQLQIDSKSLGLVSHQAY